MHRKAVDIPASVSLDGEVLKRLREEKRLTQLYVSKVVGVTTDTISRWENNRYPTMRRENALKLAEALEVPVEELLRQPSAATQAPTSPRQVRVAIVAGILAVCILGVLLAMFWHYREPPASPAGIVAERVLPRYAAPGTVIPVQVRLAQRNDDSGFILREALPKGWTLQQANPPPSSLDNDSGMVRWIVKAGDVRDRIVYLIKVDDRAVPGSFGVFRGEVVAGAGNTKSALPVTGQSQVAVAPKLWADLDGDGRIDDSEMLQASYVVDEMAGVHIDWLELERLWNAGGYRWDAAKGRFTPVRPLEAAAP